MFYSQFILAKKGPLGTIWIAAHLERKLRKNQVADTDIGVSVDSILFPDVPIALRLSSHLLLGVVRIYSRKVNYLFDDCSEALLKIKQAFRSTAVDLPPEESTAPYHSITLPETFDLDDFELPDSDIFQGNFVDHHVSSREQITLQDTMEGVVYSTSQFGLDERFGDGDTSGLDLDEELLVEKAGVAEQAGANLGSMADPQVSVQSITPFKHGENQADVSATSGSMLANLILNQVDEFDGDNDHAEYAQAPCTPGLWEEPNLSTIQETSAGDDHLEPEHQYVPEANVKENLESACSKPDTCVTRKNAVVWPSVSDTISDSAVCMSTRAGPTDQNHHQFELHEKSPSDMGTMEHLSGKISDMSLSHTGLTDQARGISPRTELLAGIIVAPDGSERTEDLQGINACIMVPDIHSIEEQHGDSVELHGRLNDNAAHISSLASSCQPIVEGISDYNQASHDTVLSDTNEVAGDPANLNHLNNGESYIESFNGWTLGEKETQSIKETQDSKSSIMSMHNMSFTDTEVLRRCNHPDILTSGGIHATDEERILVEIRSTEPTSQENIQSAPSLSGDKVAGVVSGDNQVENISCSTSYDVPALEKLLSVPEGNSDAHKNLLSENTPVQQALTRDNEGDSGSDILTGKKRSFAESSLSVQSLNLVEYSGVFNPSINAEFLPDDDDLLSSILVGRNSSVLRVKPTPTLMRTSTKRRRSAPRIISNKRKVLMDDTMVLHGDTIRQQLTNTEDIRRLRKKAPCTRPEIAMIQKQFWEDELFSEAIFTGVSMQLASLHNQPYDLGDINIIQDEVSFEGSKEPKVVTQNEETDMHLVLKGNVDEPGFDPVSITDGCEAHQVETHLMPEKQPSENYDISAEWCDIQVQKLPTSNVTEGEHLGQTAALEIDKTVISESDVEIPALPVGFESLPHVRDAVSGDTCDVTTRTVQLAYIEKHGETDSSLPMDAPSLQQDEKLDVLSVEMDPHMNIDSNTAVETNVSAGVKVDIGAVEDISEAKDELLFERVEGDCSVETVVDITDCQEHTQAAIASAAFSSEVEVGETQFVNVEKDVEEIRKDDVEGADPYLKHDADNLISNDICGEESVIATSCELEVNDSLFSLDGERVPNQQPSMSNLNSSVIGHGDFDDLDYSAIGHDTEFLNVDDDDEMGEADGDLMPNAEETRFIENSGWSSRTKAVARYLQTLFDKEAERGRKVLPVNNLLAGKTRKEASRMFFETLVLKTKDYIHVEQSKPYDNINILPRAKLMKSDF